MENRKTLSFVLIGLLFGMLIVPGVLAQAAPSSAGQSVASFLDTVSEVLNPILKFFLGDVTQAPAGGVDVGELFVIKLLLFVFSLVVVYSAAKVTPGIRENAAVIWVVTLVVSSLLARFLTSGELIMFLWLPTGVLGMTLTALLPFIIFVYFILRFDNQLIRRVGYVLYGLIFLALSIYRWKELAPSASASGMVFNLGWIYILVAVLCFLTFLFDKTIQSKMLMSTIEARGAELKAADSADLQGQIQAQRDIIKAPASTAAQVDAAQKEIKTIEGKIKKILG